MRTLQSYLAITLCLTSTMAVLAVLRIPQQAPTSVAREVEGSLAGKVLVASPDMDDPYFADTVIYMLADDASGSLGVVLNRARDHEEPGVPVDDGGPVGRNRVFMLHDDLLDQDSVRIGDVAVAADTALLDELFDGRGRFADKGCDARTRARVFVGYAGWGPGQLDSEREHGAWMVRELSADVVLSRSHAMITSAAYMH